VPESKRCPRCGAIKPRLGFARAKNRADGLQAYCRTCIADLDHARYEREVGRSVARRSRTSYAFARGAWLRSLKAGRPCTDCGQIFEPQVMQWDHLPGFEKLGDMAGGPWLAGRTPEEILAEIAKCELVCTNCHAARTSRRAGWGKRSSQAQGPSRRVMRPDLGSATHQPDAVARTCAMCGLTKPASDFHRSRTGQFSYCRDCRCVYDRSYYAERGKPARLERQRVHRDAAREWMDSLKEGRPCADCGRIFAPSIMHWDHLPEYAKVDEIGSMVASLRRARVLDEIAKCELVCANCHVMRTVRRARHTIAEDEWDYRIEGISAA
jgi:hypothetical protein